jgi:hypothetical protein
MKDFQHYVKITTALTMIIKPLIYMSASSHTHTPKCRKEKFGVIYESEIRLSVI